MAVTQSLNPTIVSIVRGGQLLIAAALVIALCLAVLNQPLGSTWLSLSLLCYALLLWRFPGAWLVVLPAILPAMDLTPWSGRIYFGEFDLFLLLTLIFGLARGCLLQVAHLPAGLRAILAAWLLIIAVACLRGWLAGFELNIGEYTHYLGPFNALRETKGLIAAVLLFLMLRLEFGQKRPVAVLFSAGMLAGLAVVCLIIVWERLFFTGPFDFAQVYRATALFSTMHLGGASVDGFIALTLPFVAVIFLMTQNRVARIAAMGLFALAMYAFMVTFSRANYLALSTMLAVTLLGDYYIRRGSKLLNPQRMKVALAATLVTGAVALPILSGGYAQSRLSTVSTDTATRLNHWADVLTAQDFSPVNLMFGRGIGSFPRAYRVLEQTRGKTPAELYLLKEDDKTFVRFTPSDKSGDLFLRQRLALPESGDGVITLTLRSHAEPGDKLLIEFCEMNILPAIPECNWIGIRTDAVEPGQWQQYSRPISLSTYGKGFFGLSRPTDILLLNRGLSGNFDIAEVKIEATNGPPVLANTDFEAGMDRWLFNSGDHLKWHTKNLFLHILFETGLVGLLLFSSVLLGALLNLIERISAGDRFALVQLVSLTGFLVLGIFDSLIDDPRISMLFLLLLFLGWSPANLPVTSQASSMLPWKKLFTGFCATALALVLVTIVNTSISRKLSPQEMLLVTLDKAEIDWPWLKERLAPIALGPFPGPERWPAQGARKAGLRMQSYSASGIPLVAAADNSFAFSDSTNERLVSNSSQLLTALREAQAGQTIVIAPGNYRLSGRLVPIGGPGTSNSPIVVTAREFGEVILELDTEEGFYVDQPYWVFQNLDIRGACTSHSRCDHAFHVVGKALGTVIRNNQLTDFNAAVKVNGLPTSAGMEAPHNGLVAQNTIYNNGPRNTANPVTPLNIDNGDNWVVRGNFIADFSKAGGNRISYGAYMKGNSSNGIFEQNIIACYWQHPRTGGKSIGLSLGGGGTGDQFCRDGNCEIEHSNGIIRNNIIARCPDDVGIYLNRAAHTRVYNNLLAGSKGIDIRFDTGSAEVFNNILEGGVYEVDGGTATSHNNLIAPACNWLFRWRDDCALEDWYADPQGGDYRLTKVERILGMGESNSELAEDFCGKQRGAVTDQGPVQYTAGASCLPQME
jgi:hypothetical protein